MSRERVVLGADERGRPVSTWAPASDKERPYGFMEPAHVATVERRKATPEELEAARARENAPSALVRRPGVIVSRHHRPDPADEELEREEEPAVPEPPPDIPKIIPESPAPDGLAALADAVAAAAEAWADKLREEYEVDQACLRWQEARRALDAAYMALDPPDAVPEPPKVVPAPTPKKAAPKRHRPGGGDSRDREIAANAERVLAVLDRHNGNTKAAGDELGLRGNVVGRIARAARDRAARQAASA